MAKLYQEAGRTRAADVLAYVVTLEGQNERPKLPKIWCSMEAHARRVGKRRTGKMHGSLKGFLEAFHSRHLALLYASRSGSMQGSTCCIVWLKKKLGVGSGHVQCIDANLSDMQRFYFALALSNPGAG